MAHQSGQWASASQDQPPRKRRPHWALAIGVGMAFTLTLPAIEIFLPGPSRGLGPSFVMAFVPLLVVLPQSPFARAGWLRERRFKMFDEFERAAIALATRRAYTIVVLILAALFAWLSLSTTAPVIPTPHGERQWAALGASLIAIVVALPIFFAELMVPMPPASDPEAGED